jgi:hypothetical protein
VCLCKEKRCVRLAVWSFDVAVNRTIERVLGRRRLTSVEEKPCSRIRWRNTGPLRAFSFRYLRFLVSGRGQGLAAVRQMDCVGISVSVNSEYAVLACSRISRPLFARKGQSRFMFTKREARQAGSQAELGVNFGSEQLELGNPETLETRPRNDEVF